MTSGAGDRSTFLTKTGWGQSGNLTTGGKTQRVTMQADFNKGVGAFDFTAQFNITPLSGDAVANAEALVSWRVEGQAVSRRLTIGAGSTITGVGQAVRIEMYDATPPQFTKMQRVPGTAALTPGSPDVVFSGVVDLATDSVIAFSTQPGVQYNIVGGSEANVTISPPYSGDPSEAAIATVAFESSAQYGVSVQVAAGLRGSSGQPPLLQPYDGLPYVAEFTSVNPSPGTGFVFIVPPGSFIAIAIPEDAGVTQAFVTAAANTPGHIIGPSVAMVSIQNKLALQRIWDSQVTSDWVPVPPGAQSIFLANNAASPFGSIIYSVALGIDG